MNRLPPGSRWVLLALMAVLALAGAPGPALRMAVLGLGGLALIPLLGWLRTLSFAPIAAAGLGAATAAWLLGSGQAVPVAFVGASIAGAAVAGVLGAAWPDRPAGGATWASLVAAVALWSALLPRLVAQPAPQPVLFGVDLSAERPLAMLGVLLLAAAATGLGNVARSRAGREMAAVGAAPELAMRSGAVVGDVRMHAGLLSGLFAGWAGLLLTLEAHALPPLASFSPAVAVTWMAVALAGGLASVPGVLLAALVIGGVGPLLGLPEVGVAGLAVVAAALGGDVLAVVRPAAERPEAEPA